MAKVALVAAQTVIAETVTADLMVAAMAAMTADRTA
jgi:hypothetical protein